MLVRRRSGWWGRNADSNSDTIIDTYAYSDSDGNANGYGYSDANTHADAYADGYPNAHSSGNIYAHTDSDAYPGSYADEHTNSHADAYAYAGDDFDTYRDANTVNYAHYRRHERRHCLRAGEAGIDSRRKLALRNYPIEAAGSFKLPVNGELHYARVRRERNRLSDLIGNSDHCCR